MRRLASVKLAEALPSLMREECPYVLHGVPSWLVDFVSDEIPAPPPVDLIVLSPAMAFCMAPLGPGRPSPGVPAPPESWRSREPGYSSPVAGLDRERLERLFVRRLMLSEDPVPLVPIFCDPREILDTLTPNGLADIVNRSWRDSVRWCLEQMPAVPADVERRGPAFSAPGTWVQRRRFLEESASVALFEMTLLHESPFTA